MQSVGHRILNTATRLALGLWLVTAGSACSGVEEPAPEAQLDTARAALERYREIATARAEGYRPSADFVMRGANGLGLPFVHPDITGVDPERPRRLFYRVLADGTYDLLGAGWSVPGDDASRAPALFGQPLLGPVAGLESAEPEYRLNAWLGRDNPAGTFAEGHPDARPPAWWPAFVQARAHAAALEDFDAAYDAGYRYQGELVAEPDLGGLGFLVVHPQARTLDLKQPNALLFVERDGTPVLTALQWRVFEQVRSGDDPSLFGNGLHGPYRLNEADAPTYWAEFLWLHHDHPDGLFAPCQIHLQLRDR